MAGTPRRRLGMLAAPAVLAAALCWPPAGSAWLRDFDVVSERTGSNSEGSKEREIDCPGEGLTSTLGGEVAASPLLPDLGLQHAGMIGAPHPFIAGFVETDPTGDSWALRGGAFCVGQAGGNPPAGGSAAAVKAVEVARATSGGESASAKSTSVDCPGDKRVISGGGSVSGVGSGLALTRFDRFDGGRKWKAVGREVDPVSGTWRVKAVAVCANITTETATSNYAGLLSSTSGPATPLDSAAGKTRTAECFQAGTSVVGGGAMLHTALDFNPDAPRDVVLTRSGPGPGTNPTTWVAEAHETDATDRVWTVRSAVVCTQLNVGPPS